MITAIKPDKDNYSTLKYVYDLYKDEINGDEFETVVKYTCYFFFETESETFIGCIYLYPKDDKTFVNAFATRGHHLLNLYILKGVLDSYGGDVYAEPLYKTSKLCVLRCGFKHYKDNIYKYERK